MMKKATSKAKRLSTVECKEILDMICRAYDCALEFHSIEDITQIPSKKSGKCVESGSKDFTCELVGRCENDRYDSLVNMTLLDEDDDLEYVIAESSESKENAMRNLVKMLSGANLKFTEEKKIYAKIPEFKTVAELKMKLAIEGKLI